MSFDEDRKRTPEELVHALRACATMGAECEQCEFFEADTPRGYDPCHESLLLTQAADYIEKQTAKEVENIYTVGDNGRYYIYGSCPACGSAVIKPDKYCSECGQRIEWKNE